MKKIISLVLCGFMCCILLTGCGDKNEEKTVSDDQTDVNKEETVEDQLTLENFRKVMKEHGLTVIDGNCNENSLDCTYTATDTRENRSTTYVFTVYKDEATATRFWKSKLNSLSDSWNIVVKDEENRKLECNYGKSGIRTIISYYGKTTSIEVDNDDSENKDSLNYVKNILAEFGYTESESKVSNDNLSDEIQTKDYTIKYGTYIGTAESGGYTLTSKVIISKENMQLETDTCEYAVKDNIIYCKDADAIQIIVTGDNQFTDASSIYTYTLED